MDMEKTQICDRNIADKRIAVVGIGGVGGYLAGMLGQVCPHLTLAARGARKESLEKEGLILHSEYKGELRAVPEQVVETGELPDIIRPMLQKQIQKMIQSVCLHLLLWIKLLQKLSKIQL